MTLFRTLMCLAVGLAMAANASAKATGPTLVFDPLAEVVLSHDRAGEPWYPASLTKMMTAYVVFQRLRRGQLKLDQAIPVSALANSQPPSKIGVPAGGTVTVDFALQSLLVYSANDMAYVLAEAAAPDIAAFAAEMNANARRLGMSGTHYVNPNGLFDPRQVTTARDIAILASHILKDFPEHAHYFSQPTVQAGKRKLANRNSLLRQMPAADGMKTGFVCNSGFNLVATATREGHKLGAIILGASSGKHRADLAEMLLVDGFDRSPASPRRRLADIPNMPLGAVVPADLTTTLCKQKNPVEIVRSKELQGWGISFGTFDTAMKADMALRGRLLSRSADAVNGPVGVIRMPGKAGYAAVAWKLEQSTSLSVCASYRQEHAPCDVLTPETFAQIAVLTPEPAPKPKQQTTQGSDNGNAKKKKKKKSNN
ncbi:MAG: D-alanyl-D-alanine carboxypeptidase [Alphaproteobacteria bacterium]|nr:D-alanyl-D-alanine carboxypeptidase [Alphaproteobacteria bacterium]